jgi:hypothetical protein
MVGAGDKHEKIRLYTPTYYGILLHTFAGINREDVRKTLAAAFGDRISSRCQLLEDHVLVQPLDALDIAPVFVKIDVEGVGDSVLRGMRQTIERWRPSMMVEVEPDQIDSIIGLMEGFGYRPAMYVARLDMILPIGSADNFFAGGNKNMYFLPKAVS